MDTRYGPPADRHERAGAALRAKLAELFPEPARLDTDPPLNRLQAEALAAPSEMDAAFLRQMEGRIYGEEETADARAWFEAGWRARAAGHARVGA